MDKNLQFQQSLAARAIAVVLIRPRSNRINDLRPLVPQILAAVAATVLPIARAFEVAPPVRSDVGR
jgi:hypothetical protein